MEVVEKTIRNTPNLHKLLTIRSVTSAEQEIHRMQNTHAIHIPSGIGI